MPLALNSASFRICLGTFADAVAWLDCVGALVMVRHYLLLCTMAGCSVSGSFSACVRHIVSTAHAWRYCVVRHFSTRAQVFWRVARNHNQTTNCGKYCKYVLVHLYLLGYSLYNIAVAKCGGRANL
jgi:hypothetical protein